MCCSLMKIQNPLSGPKPLMISSLVSPDFVSELLGQDTSRFCDSCARACWLLWFLRQERLFGGRCIEKISSKCRRSNKPIWSKARVKGGLIMKKLAVVAVNTWLSYLFGSLLLMAFIVVC